MSFNRFNIVQINDKLAYTVEHIYRYTNNLILAAKSVPYKNKNITYGYKYYLRTGMIPEDWKSANVTATHKKGSR